jgi:hypothetical protein
MRLHTKLGGYQLSQALQRAKDKGRIGGSVVFAVDSVHGSRTHPRAFELQLGTWDNTLPAGTVDQRGHKLRYRRTRNINRDDANRYAATWHEWGWLIAEIFDADPSARFGGEKGWGYKNRADFDEKTNWQFDTDLGEETA